MTHWNRKIQLYRTLVTISRLYDSYDYEVIVVDDCSDENNKIKEFESFPNVKVIEISKEEKGDRVNPSVPYNIGFENVTGDIIMIQNAENLHMWDMFEIALSEISNDNYLVFGCYRLDENCTNMLNDIDFINDDFPKHVSNIITPINMIPAEGGNWQQSFNRNAWYTHSEVRPKPYHFCSVITKENLIDKLGGFDERYSEGSSYDDDELVVRIKRMGLDFKIINEPFVIHQYHSYPSTTHSDYMWKRNKHIFETKTLKEDTCRAKVTRL